MAVAQPRLQPPSHPGAAFVCNADEKPWSMRFAALPPAREAGMIHRLPGDS